jgi:hypothetical protein
MKPSDFWCLSLCSAHHAEQHQIGEKQFEDLYKIDLRALAINFANFSPHRVLVFASVASVKAQE